MRRVPRPSWIACLATFLLPCTVAAQDGPTGFFVGGVPAINFDADEGFGYGALAELYQYGDGTADPYVWTLRPTVFLTTEGRRDLTLFFDAPDLLPSGWRLDAFVGSEEHIATPYYGLGNATPYDPALEDENGPDPFYYRFGRNRLRLTTNVQRTLRPELRLLVGAGFVRNSLTSVTDGIGTSLFEQEQGPSVEGLATHFVRAGVIWDTRDRETGTTRGTWTELLVRTSASWLGSDFDLTRWTLADRRYLPLGDRLVLAHRILLQGVGDGAPAYELFRVASSFKQDEGLGGAKSVRGVLKNRFIGRGLFLWNAELRWRAVDFSVGSQPLHLVLSGFLDQGRVWRDGVVASELLTDLHRGYGGGLRVGVGEDFVVAFDGATSSETGLQIYIGLGYLF